MNYYPTFFLLFITIVAVAVVAAIIVVAIVITRKLTQNRRVLEKLSELEELIENVRIVKTDVKQLQKEHKEVIQHINNFTKLIDQG